MENQQSKLDKAVKISIIAGMLVIAFSAAYYFVIFLPKRDMMKIELERKEKEVEFDERASKYKALEDCLNNVDEKFREILKDKTDVSANSAKFYIEMREKEKEECFKKYPQ